MRHTGNEGKVRFYFPDDFAQEVPVCTVFVKSAFQYRSYACVLYSLQDIFSILPDLWKSSLLKIYYIGYICIRADLMQGYKFIGKHICSLLLGVHDCNTLLSG